MISNKQRGRGDFGGERAFQAEEAEKGMCKAKERVKGEEPGEAAPGGGEVAGLLRSSDFILRALGASEGLIRGKICTDLCPLPCFSTLIHPPGCGLQGHGTIHCKVVCGPGQGCWWPGCRLWQWRWRGEGDLRDLKEAARPWRPSKPQPITVRAPDPGCYEDEEWR